MAVWQLSAVLEWLQGIIPLGLGTFPALASYSVVWRFAVKELILGLDSSAFLGGTSKTSGHRVVQIVAGVSIAIVFSVLLFNVVGSWLYMVYITHSKGEHKYHRNPRASPKPVMHSESEVRYAMETGEPTPNDRFRTCGRCLDPTAVGDRVYHCRKTNHHLPVCDHYCFWLWVEVYLDTIKPYLLFHVWLILLGVVVVPIEIAAASTSPKGLANFHIGMAIVAWGGVIDLTWKMARTQFYWLALKDTTSPERHQHSWTLALWNRRSHGHPGPTVSFVSLTRTHQDVRFRENYNPWCHDSWTNVKAAFGTHPWTWAFFWMRPERVRYYGLYPESDLPLGPLYRRWAMSRTGSHAVQTPEFDLLPASSSRSSRRSNARSSGTSRRSRASRAESSTGIELQDLG
ncbi:hypothetical protein GE09DRAFT_1272277 [Coniochaeta sp. 2T2.1]|nr:hypothetical protein GE09DRAFT_1272277 [Coniochaeta sp. 2T2.1]